MALDRRLHAILARLEAPGGEAVAALRALERLLPERASLADVLFVGLHHLRQDIDDPSLVVETRRLTAQAEAAERRAETAERRVAAMEAALRSALDEIEALRGALDRPDQPSSSGGARSG
ncbi:hypothetical protein [Caenispirillum bisanense]|uniref:Uncharacterized protein n=1 Tax=Caenispirillum bisanense TaxID=414052 RepID=A0A286GXT9_9PROT|nr:hypothetical protein [Caenispirillum bisanense]SOE00355.1 hypothetical protein SAMN05421508_11253 [Caenispirillum bisanense]